MMGVYLSCTLTLSHSRLQIRMYWHAGLDSLAAELLQHY